MRGGARGDEPLQILEPGRAQAGTAGLRRLGGGVDGLTRAIVARLGHPPLRDLPELRDGALVPDDHPRPAAHRRVGERVAADPARHHVRPQVAQSHEPAAALDAGEPPEPAPRDVLEEDALDRLLPAEVEDLVEPRIDE